MAALFLEDSAIAGGYVEGQSAGAGPATGSDCVGKPLASPPRFDLPPATVGHSRHYMRWYKKGPEDQTLVFDAFVCLDRDSEAAVLWPDAQLNPDQREVLRTLLDRLGYLGRAESWCEARLLKDEEAAAALPNCQPLNGEALKSKQELVRVLCADPKTAFNDEYVKPSPHFSPADGRSTR